MLLAVADLDRELGRTGREPEATMAILLQRLSTKNYRALADVTVELRDVNVLFGPNGAGKSTLLDVLWFFRDCHVRGVDEASAARSHGVGLLFDGAPGAPLVVTVATADFRYELSLALSSGRIEPFPGERLVSTDSGGEYIVRDVGSKAVTFFDTDTGEFVKASLREPEKISLGRYLDFATAVDEVNALDQRLRHLHFYPSRAFDFRFIKQKGSEQGHELRLWETGQNLWSVLLNLLGRRAVDDRYDTIIDFMRQSFPTFRDLVIQSTGPASIYGSFVERSRSEPVPASRISDGHLQMLLLLTALFAEEHPSIMLLDEPELSLHPWALAVLGKAIEAAAQKHQKQVLIATHSPVLMSQFEPADCIAVELVEGRTRLTRVSEIADIGDLLEQYATGSLYMSQVIAPQSRDEREDG